MAAASAVKEPVTCNDEDSAAVRLATFEDRTPRTRKARASVTAGQRRIAAKRCDNHTERKTRRRLAVMDSAHDGARRSVTAGQASRMNDKRAVVVVAAEVAVEVR